MAATWRGFKDIVFLLLEQKGMFYNFMVKVAGVLERGLVLFVLEELVVEVLEFKWW